MEHTTVANDGPVTSRVYAIIPAAGRSRRMVGAKQLLSVGGRPMLLATLEPLLAAHVEGVVVVTHRRIVEALPQLQDPRVIVVRNDDESSEMIDSVRLGIDAWQRQTTIAAKDGFLICPGDHPGISLADVETCLSAFTAAPDRIVIATRDARRGHPLIFPAALAEFVRSTACAGGLNALPHSYPPLVLEVPCRSPAVVRDIDTPADYGETS